MSVTSAPSERAVDATSAPTNPAPTIARRLVRRSSRPRASASAAVLSVSTPRGAGSGSARARAPVAITSGVGWRSAGDGVPAEIQLLDPMAEPQLDRALLPVGGRAQLEPVARAGQELLGEGGALVGSMWLLAEHHEPPVEALGAQRLRAARPREPRADDHDGPGGHASRSPESAS